MILGSLKRTRRKYISFNVKINVNLAGVKYKDSTQVCKNIQLRFIDSCRFMASSLDKLASYLDDDQCKHLREFYKEEEVFRLMRRKGYMDIHMSIWITGRNLRRQAYHRRMHFTAGLI